MRVAPVFPPWSLKSFGIAMLASFLAVGCASDRINVPERAIATRPHDQTAASRNATLGVALALRGRLADSVMGKELRRSWRAQANHDLLSPEQVLEMLEHHDEGATGTHGLGLSSFTQVGSPTSATEAAALTSASSVILVWDGQWGVTQHTAIPALLSTWGFYDVYCGYDATGSGINCGSVGLWASGDVLCSGAGFDCNNNDYFQPPPCGGSQRYGAEISAQHDFSWVYLNYSRTSSNRDACEIVYPPSGGAGGGGSCYDVYYWWIDGLGYHEEYIFSFCI